MNNSTDRPLPSSFLAEQAILNLLLTVPPIIEELIGVLKAESFYFLPHKLIYETIIEIYEREMSFNLVIVVTCLQDKNILQKVGGMRKIMELINKFESSSDLTLYLKEINDKHLRRIIIETGKQIIIWGYTTSEDIELLLEKVEESIFSLSQERLSKEVYTAEEILDDVFSEMKSKIKRNVPLGFNSSFKDLDSIIQGFQKSDLIVIAGRPSMGKTAFSLNLGKNIVEKYRVPLLIFSLEMSRQQIMYRFLATDSGINASRLKSGQMNEVEWKSLSNSMNRISELPIFIDDNPNLTLSDIRVTLKKVFTKKVTSGLVIVDYLQLMKSNIKLENRVQEISTITRTLKILAKEFKIPLIVLSQLSRSLESRTNKRPMLSDLRESGCLAKRKETSLISFSQKKKYRQTELKSWNKTYLVNKVISPFSFKGIKPTFLVILNNGISLCVTSNHRLLSKNGWIRAFQIQEETKIYSIIKEEKKNNSFYFYCSIKTICYQGLNKVYDKTVPGFHNYLLKSTILHNSIEQDADIVIMLYREEYYNEISSEEQITEFIVAKHRNGPIGTAKLLFKPSTTSFINL